MRLRAALRPIRTDRWTNETSAGGEVVRRGSSRGLPIIKGPDKSIPLDVLLN